MAAQDDVRRTCLALPGVSEDPTWSLAEVLTDSWRARTPRDLTER